MSPQQLVNAFQKLPQDAKAEIVMRLNLVSVDELHCAGWNTLAFSRVVRPEVRTNLVNAVVAASRR